MQLYMKQKPFSLRSRFQIKDETDQEIFTVEGEFFSFGAKLHVYDASSQEVAYIRQKVLSFMPRYDIHIGGQTVACVRQRFAFWGSRFEIDGLNWTAEGRFTAHEFVVSDGSRPVMAVRKAWFTWGDSYEMTIGSSDEALLAVCVMLAMDMAIESNRNTAARS